MKDLTNLDWPEAPFGTGHHKPWGRKSPLLCGFELQPAAEIAGPLGCVATVYVRINPREAVTAATDTLPIGFRVTVAEGPDDLPSLLEILDSALARARRHAAIIAGHHLDHSLGPLVHSNGGRWPGVTSVLGGWLDRPDQDRGFARLVDTADQPARARLDVDLTAEPQATTDRQDLAQLTLQRCLAVVMHAGASEQRLSWRGTFSVDQALHLAGWDLLQHRETATE